MTGYELYTFILCAVVLVALSALFITFLRLLVKFYIRLVRSGLEDAAILREAAQEQKRTAWDVINSVVSIVLCVVLILVFVASIAIQIGEGTTGVDISKPLVVKSASMSYKDERNTYLYTNNLDNQFDTFDIIFVDPIPGEFELELYDIVVYEAKDGTSIVHRIVGIEEPNEQHPDHRYFKFQGDAVQISDRYPVLYSQLRGIYSGERLRFVGSFVLFMQSPAGWICILLVIFAIFATPMVEKKIAAEKKLRMQRILGDDANGEGAAH